MNAIDTVNLANIDLNLLVVLDALLSEQNVTRAATRVGLSQPAMSSALNRLRLLLDDPVMVRTAGGMMPTRRAANLIGPVREILQRVETALSPARAFDPAKSTLSFRIMATDYIEFVILPPLIRRLAKAAPGISLEVWPRGQDFPEDELRTGRLDLAIGLSHVLPDRLQSRNLFEDQFLCAVRARHPKIGRRLTLSQYVRLPHLLISQRGGVTGVVDAALAQLGQRRRVAVTVPHFLVAPLVLAQTDLVLTAPERLARAYAELLPLRLLEPPVELPAFDVAMAWHERSERDPAHQWLREQLIAISRNW